ncbi:MAG: hypothetical protein RI885_1811 [Actinomycetota bacterium]
MAAVSPRRPASPRREKSATESLLSVALLLESFLFFFLALVVFALRVLPPGIALGGGAALFLATLALSRVQRFRAGIAVGWALQAVIIASGLLEPLMFFIGAGFTGLWIYCFVTGRRLDRRNAANLLADPEHPDRSTPDPSTKETP